ncbi:hypothetical protein BPAE_0123g00170 [Botrytis paeoniae]|uniref:Carrier domain-containing protein n=1 Tax=Botrytis paeoniae TaxID=278948 RepID=A0A4Z1FPV5_9HELO|nr:hypothetical protein BPAE_0123g00170 [Botrytis paeoniae]
MAAVGRSEQETSKEIEEMENLKLTETHVEYFVAHLKDRQIFAWKLQVCVGYHSPQMMQVESEYLHLIKSIERGINSTQFQMVSSVIGDIISAKVLCTPQYWVQNMISKVEFLGAVQRRCSQTTVMELTKKLDQSHLNKVSVNLWLEFGPHSALQGPIRNILASAKTCGKSGTYNSVLLRNKSAIKTLLEAMGHLYCQGPLIGLSKVNAPTLNTVNGDIFYPAAGMLSMAIEAMKQLNDDSNNFAEEEELEAGFQEICCGYIQADRGRIVSEVDHDEEDKENVERLQNLAVAMKESATQEIDSGKMHRVLNEAGLHYDPAFQPLITINFNDNNDCIGKVRHLEVSEHLQLHIIHPTTLDGLFQMTFVDDSERLIKVQADGLHFTAIFSSSVFQKDTTPKPLCYDMVQKIDIDTLSPSQIQEYCEIGHEQAIQDIQDIEWWIDLKWLMLAFGADALKQLKQSNHEPQGHLKRYAAFIQSQIDRNLAETPKIQRVYRQSILEDASWRDAIDEKFTGSFGGLHLTVGQRLAPVLLRKLDPLQLIFEDQNLVERFYEEIHERTSSFQTIGRYLEALAHKDPGMNILEIGAGTGATTKSLNEHLGFQKYSTYDFTDVGRSFLAKAADRFGDNKRMSLKVLNIEEDLLTQGFEEGSLMVSTATEALIPSPVMKWKLVLDEKSGLQMEVAQKLEQYMKEPGYLVGELLTLAEWISLPDLQESNYLVLIDLDRPLIQNLAANEFEAIQRLSSCASRILLSDSGLDRVLRQENYRVPFTTLALDGSAEKLTQRHATDVAKIVNLMSNSSNKSDLEYTGIDGYLNISRVSEATAVNNHISERKNCMEKTREFGEGQSLKMSVKTAGLIDSTEFVKDGLRFEPLDAEEIEIEVHAAGVNLKDLLDIAGKVDSDVYGFEGAGIVTRAGEQCTQIRPEIGLKFPQAASIPVAFTTAWYSLHEVGLMQPREIVLIHSGAGGTGQALIQVAKLLGSEIFTTVSTATKKQHLMKMYDIREDHIFFSRDTSFADRIMRMPQGKEVDVVINSVSGDRLAATWECIAPFGRMIEIGIGDVLTHGKLNMYPFARNTTFSTVNLDILATQRPQMMSKTGRKIIELVVENKLHPFNSLKVLPISNLAKATRALQGGKHIRKMVVDLRREANVLTSLKSRPNYTMNPNATYLVAGLGHSIARWLVASGAKNLILVSRLGPQKNKAQELLTELDKQGGRVGAPKCDITGLKSLQKMVDECASKMLPIKGFFQASMVLRDARFGNMKFQECEDGVNPKVSGSWNLNTVLPLGRDFFVLLSSIVGIIGNRGIVLGEGFVAEIPGIMESLQQISILQPIDLGEFFVL